jgi:hypothetical protein
VNIEQIEHILKGLHGEMVYVVIPFWGDISMSVIGMLNSNSNEIPMKFSVSGPTAFVFDSTDIYTIDDPKTSNKDSPKIIIRLKGPQDYRSHLVNA